MAEWLYEDGIGERRAALVDGGRIIAMRIERDSDGVRAGAVLPGRLVSRRERLARLDSGEEIYLGSEPRIAEGQPCLIRITRTAMPERDLVKRPRGEIMMNSAGRADLRETLQWRGATLRELIDRAHDPVRHLPAVGADELEEAGWSEAIEGARTGIMPFDGGVLRMALTPAMTVFDIDGALPAFELAKAGAVAAAEAIVRLGIGGSIAIDLPTMRGRGMRASVGEAFDAAVEAGERFRPVSMERMPVNPLGLLHLTRGRAVPSIAERMQFAPVESAALALLRRAERTRGTGPIAIVAHRSVATWIEQQSALVAQLERRTARPLTLRIDPERTIWGGDVH